MKSGFGRSDCESNMEYGFKVLTRINKELYKNGQHNINYYLLNVSSKLSKDLLTSKSKIINLIMYEVSNYLINYSETYRSIYINPKYSSILLFITLYMEEILNSYNGLMTYNQEKFDKYISLESKMPKDKVLKADNLYMSIDDIQNTMRLLNEAVRKYYEIYNNKILIAEFSNEELIRFNIKKNQLAHLLGLNLYKIVNNQKYIDIFKITDSEIKGILDPSFDPLGNAAVSILHKIVDISNGDLLSFEEDRLRKSRSYAYRYVDYGDEKLNLLNYSKVNFKSKSFLRFDPLERLSLVLNLPEGYELISSRKKKVESGEVLPAQHSLLLSKNGLSEQYKYSSLITNYDKLQDRRYFMSLFLKTPEELDEIQKVARPAITTKVMVVNDDDGGSGTDGGFIMREFSPEEQGGFIEEIKNDFKSLDLSEILDYFNNLGGSKKGM